MQPNCPCSLTGEHVVHFSKQGSSIKLAKVTAYWGPDAQTRLSPEIMSGLMLQLKNGEMSSEKRQGRIRGLAWGGEVTPLGINRIALIHTVVICTQA